MDSLFPETYEESRARFLMKLSRFCLKWDFLAAGNTSANELPRPQHRLAVGEAAPRENLMIISTAEHGIEGYVGSAMLKVFMDEFASHMTRKTQVCCLFTASIHGG